MKSANKIIKEIKNNLKKEIERDYLGLKEVLAYGVKEKELKEKAASGVIQVRTLSARVFYNKFDVAREFFQSGSLQGNIIKE